MSTLSQFAGKAATRVIVNAHSPGSTTPISFSTSNRDGTRALSGALTANTLATALSVTGGGYCSIAAVQTADTTSRTLRLQVVVDGTTAFDATSAATTTSGAGIWAVGTNSGGSLFHGTPIRFNTSLVIKIASSITETDKLAVQYAYTTE